MKKRMFITIEGIEGVGKSTQMELLSSYLSSNNIKHVATREPGGLGVSEAIRDILLNQEMSALTELLLYESARAEHFQKVIAPALDSGKLVICDRFADSTVSYQGYGRGLDLELIDRLNMIACENTLPDKTFVLDMPVKEAFKRLKKRGSKADRFERLDNEFYERVRTGYIELSKKYPERIMLVDAVKSIEQIHFDILGKLF